MLVATLLFWFVLSSHYCSAVIRPGNSTTVLPVGALSSRGQIADFSDQIPALELAVDIINDDDTILKDYHLDLQVLTSQVCKNVIILIEQTTYRLYTARLYIPIERYLFCVPFLLLLYSALAWTQQ